MKFRIPGAALKLTAVLLLGACQMAQETGNGPTLFDIAQSTTPWEDGYDQWFHDWEHCLRDKQFYQRIGQVRNLSEAASVFQAIGKTASRDDDEFRAIAEIFAGRTIPWETSSYPHFFFAKCVIEFGEV